MKDRLRKYKDYKDFLKQYESHKETHDARSTLYREEGFRELNEKYGPDYDHYFEGDKQDHEQNENYILYRERFDERYWDTKANSEYYEQPLGTRAWLTFKKVKQFYKDSVFLWLGICSVFVIYNAYNQSKTFRIKLEQNTNAH